MICGYSCEGFCCICIAPWIAPRSAFSENISCCWLLFQDFKETVKVKTLQFLLTLYYDKLKLSAACRVEAISRQFVTSTINLCGRLLGFMMILPLTTKYLHKSSMVWYGTFLEQQQPASSRRQARGEREGISLIMSTDARNVPSSRLSSLQNRTKGKIETYLL